MFSRAGCDVSVYRDRCIGSAKAPTTTMLFCQWYVCSHRRKEKYGLRLLFWTKFEHFIPLLGSWTQQSQGFREVLVAWKTFFHRSRLDLIIRCMMSKQWRTGWWPIILMMRSELLCCCDSYDLNNALSYRNSIVGLATFEPSGVTLGHYRAKPSVFENTSGVCSLFEWVTVRVVAALVLVLESIHVPPSPIPKHAHTFGYPIPFNPCTKDRD